MNSRRNEGATYLQEESHPYASQQVELQMYQQDRHHLFQCDKHFQLLDPGSLCLPSLAGFTSTGGITGEKPFLSAL